MSKTQRFAQFMALSVIVLAIVALTTVQWGSGW